MQEPVHGYTTSCKLSRILDGDTPEVLLPVGGRVRLRLIDCWAPETKDPAGPAATAFLKQLLSNAEKLAVYFPPITITDPGRRLDLLDLLRQTSFERLPARLFADGKDVSELMVAAKHATKDDPKRKRRKDEYDRVLD